MVEEAVRIARSPLRSTVRERVHSAVHVSDPCRDAWIKHNQALSHIQKLNSACAAFITSDPKPYRIEVQFETEPGCHVARFIEVREPDLQLGATVGDIAHNLRPALDVVAWQLAVQHDRKAACRSRGHISFPLSRDEPAFRKHRLLGFISDRALAVIESLQPYDRPNRSHIEPLRFLSTVSNADKHRIATGTFADLSFSGVSYEPETGSVVSIQDLTQPGMSIESGSPIAYIAIHGSPQTRVQVQGEPSLQVLFSSGREQYGPLVVMAMFSAVQYALTQLGAAFKARPSETRLE